MRLRIVLALAALLALSVGVSTASAGNGGNSANAKLCQKGGWATLARSEDSSSFANQGDCVSYGAHGGKLVAKGRSQLDCESFSGTFSTDPATNLAGFSQTGYAFAWSCNGASTTPGILTFDMLESLRLACEVDFGPPPDIHSAFAVITTAPGKLDFTCARQST